MLVTRCASTGALAFAALLASSTPVAGQSELVSQNDSRLNLATSYISENGAPRTVAALADSVFLGDREEIPKHSGSTRSVASLEYLQMKWIGLPDTFPAGNVAPPRYVAELYDWRFRRMATNEPAHSENSGIQAIALSSNPEFGTICAVRDGTAICNGNNDFRKVGDGTMRDGADMVPVRNLKPHVSTITVGASHVCAVASGAAKCWGENDAGQLGVPSYTTPSHPEPIQVSGLKSGVSEISAGNRHTCAIHNGEAKCWGDWRVASWSPFADDSVPATVLSGDVISLSAGDLHTCAVTANGAAHCWGCNGHDGAQLIPGRCPFKSQGLLGDGTKQNSDNPVPVFGLRSGVSEISVGAAHSCVVTTGGAAMCWGDNENGKLGDGSLRSSPVPVQVVGLESGVTAISAGRRHTCAVHNRIVKCWGAGGPTPPNTRAQVLDQLLPVPVDGLDPEVSAIAVGDHYTVAVQGDTAWAWQNLLRASPTPLSGLISENLLDALHKEFHELHGTGHYDRALLVAQKALMVAEHSGGPDNPEVAASLHNLAYLYTSQGDYATAEPLNKRSLEIWEKAFGSDHPTLVRSLDNLAKLYRATNRVAEADALRERTAQIHAIEEARIELSALVEPWRIQAENGEPNAQYEVGNAYAKHLGRLGQFDQDTAQQVLLWYGLAARNGHKEASKRLQPTATDMVCEMFQGNSEVEALFVLVLGGAIRASDVEKMQKEQDDFQCNCLVEEAFSQVPKSQHADLALFFADERGRISKESNEQMGLAVGSAGAICLRRFGPFFEQLLQRYMQ